MAFRSRRDVRTAAPAVPAPDAVPASDAVLGGYRLLRRLASGERADVHLAVAERAPSTSPDEPDPEPALVVLRVYDRDADDEAIATEIDAMEHDPTHTTPRLVDVATLPDGRACLVVERIAGRPLGPLLEGGDLSPGQVVTALAPLVVAVRELARNGLVHARLAPSDVLVDDTGRPRLIGLGAVERVDARVAASERTERARRGHGALVSLIETVADASASASRFGPVLALARDMLGRRPFAPDHEAIERALFAVADPTPLLVPSRAARIGAVPARVVPGGRGELASGSDTAARAAVARTAPVASVSAEEWVPADRRGGDAVRRLAELAQLPGLVDGLGGASETGSTLGARLRAWMRRRATVLATGGFVGTGALVLLLTAVPPAAAGGTAGDEPGEGASAAAGRSAVTAPSTSPLPLETDGAGSDAADPGAPSDDAPTVHADPVEAAATLLEIRQGCLTSRDLACVTSYAQRGSPIEARDLAAIASEEVPVSGESDLAGISLAADLGDAVVLSVPGTDEREPASLLMMRSEAGWRLREWFD